MPFGNEKPGDLPAKKMVPRMLLDPMNLTGMFGKDKEEAPQPPTPTQLANAAQAERRKQGKKQGYMSTILSMGSPLNDAGPKSLLGG
jgi:hypothetical protein